MIVTHPPLDAFEAQNASSEHTKHILAPRNTLGDSDHWIPTYLQIGPHNHNIGANHNCRRNAPDW